MALVLRAGLISSLLLVGACALPDVLRPQSGEEPRSGLRDRIGGNMLRCESDEGRTRQCAMDTSSGVRMVKQLSDAACVEGRNWGVSPTGVWVTQGCRAAFATGSGSDVSGVVRIRGAFACGSDDGRWRLCPVKGKGEVELLKQTSQSPCVREQSWGRDNRGVWVSQGCRGEFRVIGGDADEIIGDVARAPELVRCESKGGAEHRCPSRIRTSARLVRQLSESGCVEGQSWGWDQDGVWVRNGCRAEFELH